MLSLKLSVQQYGSVGGISACCCSVLCLALPWPLCRTQVCTYVCVCVRVLVRVCVCVHRHTNANTYIHAHTHTHTYIYLLSLFFLPVATVPANCPGTLGGIDCDANGTCNYSASYAVQQDNSVTFFISARTSPNTWVGFGVSDDQMMVSAEKLCVVNIHISLFYFYMYIMQCSCVHV